MRTIFKPSGHISVPNLNCHARRWSIVDWDRVEMNLKAANMSDLDTIIRLPETTYSAADFTNGLGAQLATTTAALPPSATPTVPQMDAAGAAGAVKTLSAMDVAATATKSKKSQVTPDVVPSGGAMAQDAYP
jgi:hypothetical protein